MTKDVTLILPYPGKVLSPNARPDRYALARAKKAYRTQCWWLARASNVHLLGPGAVRIALIFHPASKRARDLDNAIASMKSGLDGISDVLGIDDSKWQLEAPRWGDVKPHGEVRVLITHTPSAVGVTA